jgi:hypothetical protein
MTSESHALALDATILAVASRGRIVSGPAEGRHGTPIQEILHRDREFLGIRKPFRGQRRPGAQSIVSDPIFPPFSPSLLPATHPPTNTR